MEIDSAIFVLAGLMVLISVMHTQVVSPWFGLLSVFIGLNFHQTVITGLCPAARLFRKLGSRPGCTFE